MKQQVQAYIKMLGGKSAYSGKTRTMWITNPFKLIDLEAMVLHRFGYSLPYKLSTNATQHMDEN